MDKRSLPPDDLPPRIPPDWELAKELDEVTGRYFYQDCDRATQRVLSGCGWYFSSFINVLTLVIVCPDKNTNWQILKKLDSLSNYLKTFTNSAKIRIYPPPGEGTVMEIPVNAELI
ncbi:MAG TPA: hypothetical protein DCF68_11265 [Cyanothece sp. UBA12306]|nr:hypothetical protein [Cyanothece sp. UBA12306]